MGKLTVTLTEELAEMMRKAVDAGDYLSESEVVRDALQAWSLRRTHQKLAMDEIGRLWDIGVASGIPSDGDGAFARIRATLENDIERLHGR